jgi:hypothetical protein
VPAAAAYHGCFPCIVQPGIWYSRAHGSRSPADGGEPGEPGEHPWSACYPPRPTKDGRRRRRRGSRTYSLPCPRRSLDVPAGNRCRGGVIAERNGQGRRLSARGVAGASGSFPLAKLEPASSLPPTAYATSPSTARRMNKPFLRPNVKQFCAVDRFFDLATSMPSSRAISTPPPGRVAHPVTPLARRHILLC